jgi:hypothetical protein
LSHAELERELTESKRTIETNLGRPCELFAYPNGSPDAFGDREKRALRRGGYRCGLSLQGRLNPRGSDPFALDRVNISRQFHPALLNARLTGAAADARRLRALVLILGGRRWRLRSTLGVPESV